MKKNSLIYVAGHNGLVGSEIVKKLKEKGYTNILTRNKKRLDLTNQKKTNKFFKKKKPKYVFVAAAKVGGIVGNLTSPANYIYDNLQIQNNIIHNSCCSGVKKLLFLGSSCIYPKLCKQPIKEEYFMNGELEKTNEAYAIAKIAGIKMCQSYNKQYDTNFISLMPTNLYGPGDNYDLENSHVFAAMIRKFHDAKMKIGNKYVTLWGTGSPYREFLHVDDLASASLFLMINYDDSEIINVGTGKDINIFDLANLIKDIVGYEGKIVFDNSKPDGTPKKLLDVSKIHNLGWSHTIDIEEGIKKTYNNYISS